ncbi:hypothetical protein WR25_05924 [Diploscapter pachys]|uniref:Uncharacterized protein n=1 Tax=Diploscapter pachys TaxID=2018661 RepID=A0A2A2J1C4_9BILA|nr:hypothetical protein WR25_05924 [Diploscapter pachys]
MEREANATRKDLNDAQIRQVEEQKKGLDAQRNLHSSEYQRKIEEKKENQKQYQIEQKQTMNQLVAKKAENQVEQSSQLLNQIQDHLSRINISTQAAAQGAHEFVYRDELRSSVKDIEDLKKELDREIDRLTEATRELPMLYHENKLEETLQKFKENIKHSAEEEHSRKKQAALESKSQMQSIQGSAEA